MKTKKCGRLNFPMTEKRIKLNYSKTKEWGLSTN